MSYNIVRRSRYIEWSHKNSRRTERGLGYSLLPADAVPREYIDCKEQFLAACARLEAVLDAALSASEGSPRSLTLPGTGAVYIFYLSGPLSDKCEMRYVILEDAIQREMERVK